MASTEDIEARLCAYVDGELDEAARGEIERHLADNPQHAKLIEELSRQRDMLRALPRARAPGDISEHLQASLERAVLLGDDPADEVVLRINRWSQVRAAAAVLLLVFGLAAVVYYVVPRPGANTTIAIVAPDVTSEATAPATSPTTGGGVILTGDGQPDPDHRPATPEIDRVLTDLSRAGATGIDAGTSRSDAQSAPAEVLVTVDASDLFAAQTRVEQYLISNHIAYESVSADMPEPLMLKDSQVGLGSRAQDIKMQMKSNQPAEPGTALGTPAADVSSRAGSPLAERTGPPQATVQIGVVASPESKDSAESFGPTTAPAQQPMKRGQAGAANRDEGAPMQQVFRARNMTRRDVEMMCSNISDRSAGHIAQVVGETRVKAGELNMPLAPFAAAHPDAPAGQAEILLGASPSTAPADQERDGWLPFGVLPPATQPSDKDAGILIIGGSATPNGDDQRVDVMIVVRAEIEQPKPDAADPSEQIDPAEVPETAEPSTQPTDDVLSPATSPATQPSSP